MTLAACAIARNESPYLLEWIAYQRVIGAELIVLYDNGHDPAGELLLTRLDLAGVIERVPWGGSYPNGPQLPAYADALRRLKGRADWVLMCDIDEYVVPVQSDSVSAFLHDRDCDAIWVPWLIFGSAHAEDAEPGLTIERFCLRQAIDDDTLTPVKSIVRPDVVTRPRIHMHDIATDAYENPAGERDYVWTPSGRRRSSQLARGYEQLRVHHYMTRSRREWVEKVQRGRADRGHADAEVSRQLDEFETWDRNEVFDDSAVRFVPAVRAEMDAIERLAFGD